MQAPQYAAKPGAATSAPKPKWTAHGHVAAGRGHKVIAFLPEQEKVVVGIRCRGEENIHTIPWQGTIYSNVDVRRRVHASLG